MAEPRLTVLRSTTLEPADVGEGPVLSWDEFHGRVLRDGWRRSLWRYPGIDLVTREAEYLHRPLATAILLRALTLQRCRLLDERGHELPLGWRRLLEGGVGAVRDRLAGPRLRARVARRIEALRANASSGGSLEPLDASRRPLYLRTDLVFGLTSGGSVGHVAGVLNHLDEFVGSPLFVTTDRIPAVREDLECHLLSLPRRWWDFTELLALACNESFAAQLERVAPRRPAFVYQRHSTHSFVGLELARSRGVPFVLEFNGSEPWIARHWGGSHLVYEELAERIEATNLAGADLVVAVSEAGREQAVECGASPERVLVNPNGVEVDRFRPDVDGSGVRGHLGLDDRLVLGFIGTFGPWHGTEVLAEAFCRLEEADPEERGRRALLMIGDGPLLSNVRGVFEARGVSEAVRCIGRVAQAEAPRHLAACDVLVSPHVPNPDGSPFFGSPTKLFEYMAMGRPIVASRLGQIGDVLEHERTALLVPPGDVGALVAALRRLADSPDLRRRLGAAAREVAERSHTWRRHTARIVEALADRVGRRPGAAGEVTQAAEGAP